MFNGLRLSLFLLFCAASPVFGAVIDQSYNGPALFLSRTERVGQEFTPAFPVVDFVDIVMRDVDPNTNPAVQYRALIREGSMSGPIIATSSDTLIPDNINQPQTYAMTRFAFPQRVPVIPNELYVFDISRVSSTGANIMALYSYNLDGGDGGYTGGRMVYLGALNSSMDLRFAEGVHFPTGDFNHDNQINDADITIWRSNFARQVPDHTLGNADANNYVDGADFLYWQRDFGRFISVAASIPEPGGAVLMGNAMMITFALRSRRGAARPLSRQFRSSPGGQRLRGAMQSN